MEEAKVWIFKVDHDPAPWEDYSYPNRVFVGTEEQAEAELKKIEESTPSKWLWMMNEVRHNKIYYA